ncbi:MAG: glucosaminidase domain-containing protein [Lachnospiraceae bacterium]
MEYRKINALLATLLLGMLVCFNLPIHGIAQKPKDTAKVTLAQKDFMPCPTLALAKKKAQAEKPVEQPVVQPAPQPAAQPAEQEMPQPNIQPPEQEIEEVIAPGAYPIMGKAVTSVEKMVQFYETQGQPYPADALAPGGAGDIQTFCQMYVDESLAEGVRPEVAFVQTMKETGWLQYGGDSHVEQYNFAGLGTTGGGVEGNAFPDVRTGIRAQIQHLKAYATADPLNQECVDARYDYVAKGCAPYVEWLGQNENPGGYGWATGEQYGYDIVDMIQKLKAL